VVDSHPTGVVGLWLPLVTAFEVFVDVDRVQYHLHVVAPLIAALSATRV